MLDNYGRRLLCNVLHDEALANPHRLFAVVAKTNDVADGYHFVDFQQVERAVNYLSGWLQDRFENGKQASPGTTLCYMGVPDIRYCMIVYAAIKCRYKILLPSPRNTPAVNISMLEQTGCSRLVYASEVEPVIGALKPSAQGLACESIPAIKDLLELPDIRYPYEFDYAQLWKEPIIILHSSGSTGLPKLVTWTHGTIAAVDFRDWPAIEGRRNHDFAASLRFPDRQEGRLLDPFPPFHAGGVMTKILTPLWNLTVVVFGPAQRPPSGALIAQMMRELKPNGILIPPSIGEQILREPDNKELFSSLDYAMFGGGPVSREAAFKISARTTIISAFGSTETIHVRQLVTAPEDFDYVEFHPNERIEMQNIGNELYEMVFQIREEFAGDLAVYHNFPTVSEWRSRDLFEKHPSKPNLWKFYGRVDDIIVFSNGEKLCPLPMEMAIGSMSNVNGALVVGQGHPQPILLIESASEEGKPTVEDLWPAVEAANSLLPSFGRISRSAILFTDPNKPLKRATKGTVIRKLSETLYSQEIEAFFQNQHAKATPMAFMPSAYRLEDIESVIRSILQQVSVGTDIGNNDNLYAHGMDSIKTVEVLGHIKSSLEASRSGSRLDWLRMETMYLHPTISQLASMLVSFLNNGVVPTKPNKISVMQKLIQEYTLDLPNISSTPKQSNPTNQMNILITGTTGFFGPYILDRLMKLPQVNRIYCLDRAARAREEFEKRTSSLPKDVTFFVCDTGTPKLGLSDTDYSQLVENCTLILHNAWMVDFNLPLDSFENSLQSLRNLIDLSCIANHRSRILFVSTIAATGAWTPEGTIQQTVPEDFAGDLSSTVQNGYAESKRVAEHVLQAAAAAGIPTTVLRVGHLVPEIDKSLPERDHLTVFLRTCQGLGLVASDLFDIMDLLPVNVAAEAVGEIVDYESRKVTDASPRVFNLVNHKHTPWSEMVHTIESWANGSVKRVSMNEWIDTLKKKHLEDAQSIKHLPALLMLPFFETLSKCGPTHHYDQTKLLTISPAMAKAVAVEGSAVQSWLQRL